MLAVASEVLPLPEPASRRAEPPEQQAQAQQQRRRRRRPHREQSALHRLALEKRNSRFTSEPRAADREAAKAAGERAEGWSRRVVGAWPGSGASLQRGGLNRSEASDSALGGKGDGPSRRPSNPSLWQ